jgi:carbonic anhydrase
VQVNYAKGSQVQADSHEHAPYVGMVPYAPGSMLHHEGEAFELKQFHFHSPSEHTLNGKSFPMEMHLVHGDRNGNLAVVSVLMTEGATDNPVIAKLWTQMPTKMGEKNNLGAEINAVDLLPKSKDYFRYSGSLTTPPCSEGVRWYVMKEAIAVSKAQIDAFRQAVGSPNNRPVQPVNARVVLQ